MHSYLLRICLLVPLMLIGVVRQAVARAGEADSVKDERIVVNQREYWVHTVEKGETLYAISRRYGISLTEIATANPDIYYGLKKGAKLRIPIPPSQRVGQDTVKPEFVVHIVEPGDNLFQLSRQYGISVRSIRLANRLKSDTLRVHETLRIPTQELPNAADSLQFIVHVVAKGESLFGLAKSYGVGQDDILKLNPEVEAQGLRAGQVLRIPTKLGMEPENREEDFTPATPEPAVVSPCDASVAFGKGRTLEVALILPFTQGGKRRDDTPVEPEEEAVSSHSPGVDGRFLDFYQGFLLAVERYKFLGYSIRLKVIDSQQNPDLLNGLVNSGQLEEANLIVGPVYPKAISVVSQWAAARRISLVSPLSGKTPSFEANPFLFQANPSDITQIRQMVANLPLEGVRRVVMISETTPADEDLANNVELMLQSEVARRPGADSITVQVVNHAQANDPRKTDPNINRALDPRGLTLVIVPSTREPYVSEVLGQLNTLAIRDKRNIRVFGLPKWLKMENLDFAQLINLHVTIASPFYVDYSSQLVSNFIDDYRSTYRAEPSKFAFQGYDVANYFMGAIFEYGEDFRYCLPNLQVPLLQNSFRFVQSQQFGSYESTGIYLIEFTKSGLMPIGQ